MPQRPIVIVGAGPTGLTAAMELTRMGFPVRLVERATAASRTSKALAIQARTLELFAQRELADEMLRIGNRANHVTIHSARKALGKIDLSTIPSRFNFVLLLPQSDTERLLGEHLDKHGVRIE